MGKSKKVAIKYGRLRKEIGLELSAAPAAAGGPNTWEIVLYEKVCADVSVMVSKEHGRRAILRREAKVLWLVSLIERNEGYATVRAIVEVFKTTGKTGLVNLFNFGWLRRVTIPNGKRGRNAVGYATTEEGRATLKYMRERWEHHLEGLRLDRTEYVTGKQLGQWHTNKTKRRSGQIDEAALQQRRYGT